MGLSISTDLLCLGTENGKSKTKLTSPSHQLDMQVLINRMQADVLRDHGSF